MREALDLIIQSVKTHEGCVLIAYPDPVWKGIKRTPANWNEWGKPWTIGWGETLGIKEGMVWTQEQADDRLKQRVGQFLMAVYRKCPALFLEAPERAAACTSLAYNIGVGAFGVSSVCRNTMRHEFMAAANAFLLWNKAKGKVLRGLTIRRHEERKLYLSDFVRP
jgi:lysozyme